MNPTHQYTITGNSTVILTIIDSAGVLDSAYLNGTTGEHCWMQSRPLLAPDMFT